MANHTDFATPYEKFCYDNAVKFTAVRGKIRNRTRRDFDTFADALAFAKTYTDGRTMIYAITEHDNHAHICNA